MMISPSIESIETIVNDTLSVITLIESLSPDQDGALEAYKNRCSKIPDQLRAGLIRIAVVGVIKSGKSTFINALTGRELVKRGAGVVTSITTRIRKGKKNRAIIHLKSWDAINRSIEMVLDMFPQDRPEDHFDMRRKKDRAFLQTVYQTLIPTHSDTMEGIRPEALVMKNALEGYATCRDIIEADEREVVYEAKAFDRHKEFTADPAKAFYVKDVCLELFGKAIPAGVEIADCQGADSTDPGQLSQIISYIESANLIVYCISSRTGLRRSDMGFLKTINRLGLKNILFVNNCDLTEHENLEDLVRIRDNILKELTLLVPAPRLFSFSALYALFESLEKNLTKRNAKRLSFWRDDPDMTRFCTENYGIFLDAYTQLLETRQFDLLFANPLERLRLVAHALKRNLGIMEGVLAEGPEDRENAREQLRDIEENAKRLRVIVDNSIQGAVSGLTREVEANLENAFVKDAANITQEVTRFINGADIDVAQYRAGVKETGFKQILYLMFQDFKRQLDCFIIEQMVPELKRLVEIQEKRIEEYFQSLMDSYQIDFLTKTGKIGGLDKGYVPEQLLEKSPGAIRAVHMDNIKKILGLKLPDQVFSAQYTTRMQTRAYTNFGLHSFVLFIGALVDRHVRFSFTPGLNKAAAKIKKESLNLVRQQVQGYHRALKEAYFTPLIQAVTREFEDKIIQRFSLYETLNKDMEHFFDLKADERKKHLEKIQAANKEICCILKTMDKFSLTSPTS